MWDYTRSMMFGTSDASRNMQELATSIGLSFEGLHGMVTVVFFSRSQASFASNPA